MVVGNESRRVRALEEKRGGFEPYLMLGRSSTASYERTKSPFSCEFAVMGRVQGHGRG